MMKGGNVFSVTSPQKFSPDRIIFLNDPRRQLGKGKIVERIAVKKELTKISMPPIERE